LNIITGIKNYALRLVLYIVLVHLIVDIFDILTSLPLYSLSASEVGKVF